MKLWNKGYKLNEFIEEFTVGNDYLLDKRLVFYDCIASKAHAKMLHKISILSESECVDLFKGLDEIIELDKKGSFEIRQSDEDCHTAIENYLTKHYGTVGKKIHTARSRNDQVLTALRLYEKDALQQIKVLVFSFIEAIDGCIKKYGSIEFPGYTHMQKAMPTDIATFLGCFSAAATDNLSLIDSIIHLIDQSPMGSGAGFGIPLLAVDRSFTASEMGFLHVMKNPIYCQMSRSKFEPSIVHILTQIMFDLNKLASDLILFSTQEFGFVSFPIELLTGSSIMPQKKNPDFLELVRAHYHIVISEEFKMKSLTANLISGYNRDIQLTKESLFTSFDITKQSLEIISLIIDRISFNENTIKKALSEELYATHKAYELVKKGMSFRDAYLTIARQNQQ